MSAPQLRVGIKAINVCGGAAVLDVRTMAVSRRLGLERFDKVLIKNKTVSLHYEDPVSYGVNANSGARGSSCCAPSRTSTANTPGRES